MHKLFHKSRTNWLPILVICGAIIATSSLPATAAKLITGKQIKNNSITGGDIKNGSIGKSDLAKSVGTIGATGAAGATGATGAAGSARAYAQVSPATPSLVSARTKGFSAVNRIATGIYCLTLSDSSIDPDAQPAMATVEFGNTAAGDIGATVMARGSNSSIPDACAAGQYVVRAFDETNAASNTVAFSVLVP